MTQFKLSVMYLLVNIAALLFPIVILGLFMGLKIETDFSYFAWYLLIIPLLINLVTFFFTKKENLSSIFMTVSLFLSYSVAYYLYYIIVNGAFSKFSL